MKTNTLWSQGFSLELRLSPDGRELVCDWGTLENSEANPTRECGIRPLVLVSLDLAVKLKLEGPQPAPYGGTHTFFTRDERCFIRLDYEGNSWTWELVHAHFWDDDEMRAKGTPNEEFLVGRWSD